MRYAASMLGSRLGASLLVAACALGAACSPVKRPDGGEGLLQVGASAPDVVAKDADLREVRLSALRGKPVVVYFYPKDGTPGCTKEACAFRDAWARFEKGGVAIIGVSSDSEQKHQEFQREHHLPFALAADESGSVAQSYGVSKKLWGYSRVTFLVDRRGSVAHVWPDVDPGVHADAVLAEAAKLP